MRLSHRSVYKASWTLRKVITNPAEHFVVIASFLCFRWVGHRKLFIATKRKEFKGNILMFLMLCSLRPPLFCPLLFLSHSFLDLILLCFLFSFVCCLFLPSCFETFADLHGNGSLCDDIFSDNIMSTLHAGTTNWALPVHNFFQWRWKVTAVSNSLNWKCYVLNWLTDEVETF